MVEYQDGRVPPGAAEFRANGGQEQEGDEYSVWDGKKDYSADELEAAKAFLVWKRGDQQGPPPESSMGSLKALVHLIEAENEQDARAVFSRRLESTPDVDGGLEEQE